MKRILITGGAGFIGCNAAARFMRDGWSVVILDNLSRPGAQINLDWLTTLGRFELIRADVRDGEAIRHAIVDESPLDAVLHLAAQVAVTTSCANPREDFEVNALGTFNVLEAVREAVGAPIVIFASTNKVYGSLDHGSSAAIGEVFNIGGGPRNTLSILEALGRIEAYSGRPVFRRTATIRPGDQNVFICDISKASRLLGWTPKIDVTRGIETLRQWVEEGEAVLALPR